METGGKFYETAWKNADRKVVEGAVSRGIIKRVPHSPGGIHQLSESLREQHPNLDSIHYSEFHRTVMF